MCGDRVLDLCAVDVLTTRDDHVLEAIDQVEVAVLVFAYEVARVEPATPECRFVLVWFVPVPTHDRWPAVDDLADLAARDIVHLGVDDAHFDIEQGHADRSDL